MARVRFIHWNAAEAAELIALLRGLGHQVEYAQFNPGLLKAMRDDPPEAVVIDLGRLPSQGRDVAITVRRYKATRSVPLVFVGGDPAKVARIQALLPDAVYTAWSEIGLALDYALAHSPDEPVVPASIMASYRGTPLAKKLGIKPGSVAALDGAPHGFEETLGALPEGAALIRDPARERDLTLWFVRSRRELDDGIQRMVPFGSKGGLWIIWPKKASGVVSDVSQTVVREVGLAAGLVDYKVCSVDATWSGLRFTLRERK